MMTAKLAFKNLKKSFKDYTIYFLTIALGVCLFYVFNSIDSQESMIKLSDDTRDYFKLLVEMIDGMSVFVAVILAFLIIYANKFLIKRRKKELSIYMLLGMEKGKISSIIVFETLFSGLIAMVVGLLVGIFASQGLSVIIANMFKAKVKAFNFTFSSTSLIKTLIYFGLIFAIVMIFNVINITRCKLITLIQSGKKNEVGKVKSFWLSMILFILACGCIGFAYNRILKNGFMEPNRDFKLAIAFGTIGTFLFFISMSGFLLQIIKKSKRLYYKNLNMFTLRQFSNKVNTNCISMTIISIMLLLTIGILACAMSMNRAMNLSLEKNNPQDASFFSGKIYNITDDGKVDMGSQKLCTKEFSEDPDIRKIVKDSTIVNKYITGHTFRDLIGTDEQDIPLSEEQPIECITLSDYNNVMKMRGQKPLKLADDEYALACNSSEVKKFYDLDNMPDLEINGKIMKYNKGGLVDVQIENMPQPATFCTIIVNDENADNLILAGATYLMNFKNGERDFDTFKKAAEKEEYTNDEDFSAIYTMAYTKQDSADACAGISVIATFLSIYIGIVFLISSCAVLALQQLSESTDNAFRYKLLRKIGASSKSLSQALFRQ
ncbi:MAG: FtsX-like permease family protein, partial [Oscillospiraceae bacterium]